MCRLEVEEAVLLVRMLHRGSLCLISIPSNRRLQLASKICAEDTVCGRLTEVFLALERLDFAACMPYDVRCPICQKPFEFPCGTVTHQIQARPVDCGE